jgi:multidrug resistance protein, MATE family
MEDIKENKPKEADYHGGYFQVWILSYPVVITMLAQTLAGLFGTMMVGRINTAQLGAAGLGSMIGWAFLSFFNGIISTASTFVAQDYGAKEYKDIGKIVWHYIYIAVASYVIILLLGTASRFLLGLIGSSAEVEAYSKTYLKIQLLFGIGVFGSFAFIGFFRGIGDTKTPMYISITTNAFCVLLFYLLIFGKLGLPRLEVTGMAIGGGISSILSLIMYLLVFLSKKNDALYQTRKLYKVDLKYIRRIIRIGLPSGIQFFLDTASFSVFTSFIARMGNVQLAASNAVMTFLNASFMPLFGISVASTTLVGQFMGAKNPKLARKSGLTTIKIGMSVGTLMAITFLVFPTHLIALISKDSEVIVLGAKILMLISITRISEGLGVCSGGGLRGAGDTRFPMFVGLTYAWTVFTPLAYVLGHVFDKGAIGAWVATTIYILLYGLTVFIRFLSGKWQSIRI